MGRLKHLFTKLLSSAGRWEKKRRQRLQLSGRQPRPPLLQTRINAKLQKFSPNWRWLLINEMLLHLFAKFDLHPSDAFREYRCWNDEYSFLNMIGGKLRDHRNSKHANHFKFTNQPRETAALWLYISALSILCQYQQNVPDEVSLLYDIYSSTMKIIRTVFRWLMFAYTIKGVFLPQEIETFTLLESIIVKINLFCLSQISLTS